MGENSQGCGHSFPEGDSLCLKWRFEASKPRRARYRNRDAEVEAICSRADSAIYITFVTQSSHIRIIKSQAW